jgi:Protein of unknown function (DUF559)
MDREGFGGVAPVGVLAAAFGEAHVRHALRRGRWQRPYPGVVVTHNGPLTVNERQRAAVTWAGPRAALSHATAAEMAGLKGFDSATIHVTIPRGTHSRRATGVAVHQSRVLERDLHPARQPRQTRIERSLLDIASSTATDNLARSVLAAAVQQRLTTASRTRALLALYPTMPRRALIAATLDDVEGGSHSLPELEFITAIRRARLPVPDRQAVWLRADGRAYLDARWDGARVTVEIDGVGHLDPRTWVYDLERQNELVASGQRVLRFPSFAVREDPGHVTDRLREVLARSVR